MPDREVDLGAVSITYNNPIIITPTVGTMAYSGLTYDDWTNAKMTYDMVIKGGIIYGNADS